MAWTIARPALQLTALLFGKHEGPRLAAQALVILGDLAVCVVTTRKRR